MEKVKESVYKALRDDASASGVRALTGGAATPWGVYQARLPESLDFTSKSYLTYYVTARVPSASDSDLSARLREAVISVTAWSSSDTTKDRLLRRVENVLVHCRRVSQPSVQAAIHDIQFENSGPDLFDEQAQCFYRTDQYRVWYRDDITN